MSYNYESILRTWWEMVKTKDKMGERVLEVISHPDSTPEQIALVADRYRAVCASLRAERKKVLEVLYTSGKYTPSANMIAEQKI